MFYEVYIDIFFAVNVMLDFFVIETVRKIQHYKSTTIRVVMASMAGSLVLCIFLCLPVRQYRLVRLFFYTGAYVGMAAIAFPKNRKAGMIKAVLGLYAVSLLLNGIYQWLSLKIEHCFQLLAVSTGIYLLIDVTWFIYRQSRENEKNIYDVHICFQDRDIFLKGLWDTGNRLHSPYDGRGVSIINYECIQSYISEGMQKYVESGIVMPDVTMPSEEKILLIPYQTVGLRHAFMPVISAHSMVVEKDGVEIEYRKPLLGISKNPVSQGNLFQMILTTDSR